MTPEQISALSDSALKTTFKVENDDLNAALAEIEEAEENLASLRGEVDYGVSVLTFLTLEASRRGVSL